MGTRLRVTVEAPGRTRAEGLTEAALREIERLERTLSTWDTATALSRLNRSAIGAPVEIDPDLAALLRETETWAVRTGRAFDPTVGALIDAWDLRGPGREPEPAELAAARQATGRRAFDLTGTRAADGSGHRPQVAVRRDGAAWIDSGGFGKGAALRAVATVFREAAVTPTHALLDFGGQFLLVGPASASWRIDVAHPGRRNEAYVTLAVPPGSVASSGASERPGHLLDPRTGRPVAAWGSVTVVTADPLEADVLSTALYVMGPREGLIWARRAGVAALFIEERAGEVVPSWTSAMNPWLIDGSHEPSDTDESRMRS